jgi:hypothetical protein
MTNNRLLTAMLAGCLLLGGCGTLRPDDGMETVSVDMADDSGAAGAALAAAAR